MKKNFFKLIGIAAIAAVIGFSMAACTSGGGNGGGSEPYDGPKTIKITGYDASQGITAYSVIVFSESADPKGWPPIAIAVEDINGQTITYPLVKWDEDVLSAGGWDWGDPNLEPWTGTGKFFVVIECQPPKDQTRDGSRYVYSTDGINPALVDIKEAVTTLQWAKFIWLTDTTFG